MVGATGVVATVPVGRLLANVMEGVVADIAAVIINCCCCCWSAFVALPAIAVTVLVAAVLANLAQEGEQ